MIKAYSGCHLLLMFIIMNNASSRPKQRTQTLRIKYKSRIKLWNMERLINRTYKTSHPIAVQ